MVNHPNRGNKKTESKNPKPAQIKKARLAAGLSQTAAAELVHTTCRVWQQWENDEGATSLSGHSTHRRMHPAFWELFQIKVAQMGD